MLQNRIEPSKAAACQVHRAERRAASALTDSIQLQVRIAASRDEMGLPITFSAGAIARAAAAAASIAAGLEQLGECHQQLKADKSALGLDVVSFGDECPWPLNASEANETAAVQPALRAVG